MELDPHLTQYTKLNLKWIKNLNIKDKTIKLLEDNTGRNLHDFGFSNGFLDTTLKARVTKEKIDQLDFIKTKNFCESKDIIGTALAV